VLRLATLALLSLALLAAGCGDDDEPAKKAAPEKVDGCDRVKAPDAKPDGGRTQPTTALDPGKTYDVKFATTCGSVTVRVDQKTSPRTAASFVELARSGFYDDTTFHRIVPGFVIQGGDPTGTGAGGPGYSTRDVPPASARYTRGVVAMAKTGAEPAGTAGSQFYVVTGADAGLPPEYALLGEVVAGRATTARIERQGDPQSGGEGVPLQPVLIEKATVSAK
jgi:cyclophilin family peptidyl-prolyl cis-trans isomerase